MKKIIVAAFVSLISLSSFAADGCSNKDLKGVWNVYITHPSRMNRSYVCTFRVDNPKSFAGNCGTTFSPARGSLSVSDLCYVSGRIAGNDVSALMPMSDKRMGSGFVRNNNKGRRFLRMVLQHDLTH